MRPTITPPFTAQSIDQRIILLLRREGAKNMEHLTTRTGLGRKRVLHSVDRLSRAGKVSLTLARPFECRVSVTGPVR
jgi:predicted transcriptional regulator